MSKARALLLFGESFVPGGIQRFNRTFITSCGKLDLDCDVLSLADTEQAARAATVPSSVHVRVFARNKLAFTMAAARAIFSRQYDFVLIGHINLLVTMAAIAALLPKAWRPQLLLIAHGIEVWDGISGARRRALRLMTRILCVSDFTRRRMREQAPEVPEAVFQVFPNALSETWSKWAPDATASVPTLDTLPGRFVLSVTRMDRHDRDKGLDTVMAALSELHQTDLHYVIAGRGNDVDYLKDTARRLGLESRVHFVGGVSDEELVGLYRRCLAFVLPSRKEGFGIVFLEAMYFGAPVVAAREKGILDVVVDGETGLLVPFGDVNGLRIALQRVVTDEVLRRKLRSQARETVTGSGRFTQSAFVERCRVLVQESGNSGAVALSPNCRAP